MARYGINPNYLAAGLFIAAGAGLHAYGTSEHNYANNLKNNTTHEAAPSHEWADYQRRADLVNGIGNIAIGLGIATIIFDPFERLKTYQENKNTPEQPQ